MQEKIERFAALLHEQQAARVAKDYPNIPNPTVYASVRIVPGRRWIKVDIGSDTGGWSGRYMVEATTGAIYGIKAYGKVHRGHYYGTLDTIDQMNWREYTGTQKRMAV